MLLIEPLDFLGRMHVAVSMVRQSARLNLSKNLGKKLGFRSYVGEKLNVKENSGQSYQSPLVNDIPLRPSTHFTNSD